MKKDIYKYFAAAAVLLIGLMSFAACGSGGGAAANANNSTLAKNDNSNSAANETNSANTNEAKDTSPVSMTAAEFFEKSTKDGATNKEYYNRTVTVSDLYLKEMTTSELTLRKEPSYSSNYDYIRCIGGFTEYSESFDRINAAAKDGKMLKATIRGIFYEAKKDAYPSDQTIAAFRDCVLTDLEK